MATQAQPEIVVSAPPPESLGKRRPLALSDYLWAMPALILVVGVIHAGIAANVFYSLFDWSGVGSPTDFVGGANYSKLLQDPVFWQALRNTLVFAVATVAIQLTLGLALAILVRTKVRLRGLLRTLVFVPAAVNSAAFAASRTAIGCTAGSYSGLGTAS